MVMVKVKEKEVCGLITLKWIVKRQIGVVWTGLIWLRIGTGGGLL
jgi:hypothetical protein